jgi:hypothetical protein
MEPESLPATYSALSWRTVRASERFGHNWLAKGLKRHVIDRAAVLRRIDRERLKT